MKKSILALLLSSLVLLNGCDDKGGSDTGKVNVVAAHNQTNLDSPYQTGMLKLKDDAEKSQLFNIEVHAGTIGTNENELVEKLILGGADVVLVSPGFMTSLGIDEVDIFSLLYLFNDYKHWEKVVDGDIGKKIADIIYEKSGKKYYVKSYWTAGVRHWYGKKPVFKPEDLKGLKIRTQTSGVVSDYWLSIGAIPTSVAWAELYQALSSNVVDGAENAYPYLVPMEHHKTNNGKYISETGHDYTTRFLLVRAGLWDKLDDKHKEVFENAMKAATDAERNAVYVEEKNYKEKAIADGAKVNSLDTTPFVLKAVEIQDKWGKEHNMVDVIEQIRKLAKD
ncbi:C4-dicarboxylate ABC transporter substrate-binding protein [Gallibacterium anatis]|uniref:Bacterial extracellular solute-binding protein, family 7 n=2 Tax=Gallibacterium anatis TaxID=750 RepID=F4HCL6_GALAU|nr:TRAP transporter substrate-binding protein [Gallibacterium anatis]AEC17704.1 Bacterial extracellular solute-binding protein, family 7 [Gallibacterium anatis UMN179]KGQ41566.1 C4-dicarboxylate ABC transporter substrate-binding protein [Gallibacterium anatis]KGQ58471.1 C4-dicarboxylate ABC transporter substrate-binding protein [Gallibacterium anatis DSM 16844 = F 149]WIM83706.1 TRAP transporter substrate-binding protein [Gallibacterium anatis]WKS96988.1 TRAP transporter substrate-binding prot